MLDYDFLNKTLNPDKNKMPVEGNEHRMVRVAFDVFKVQGEDDLWQVQADDDGNEFLVRTYDLKDEELSTELNWSVESDKKEANLTIMYSGTPIHRVAASDFGAKTKEDVVELSNLIKEKLSLDENFLAKFIDDLPEAKKAALLSYDEIGNIYKKANNFGPLLNKVHKGKNLSRNDFDGLQVRDINELNTSLDVLQKIHDIQNAIDGKKTEQPSEEKTASQQLKESLKLVDKVNTLFSELKKKSLNKSADGTEKFNIRQDPTPDFVELPNIDETKLNIVPEKTTKPYREIPGHFREDEPVKELINRELKDRLGVDHFVRKMDISDPKNMIIMVEVNDYENDVVKYIVAKAEPYRSHIKFTEVTFDTNLEKAKLDYENRIQNN